MNDLSAKISGVQKSNPLFLDPLEIVQLEEKNNSSNRSQIERLSHDLKEITALYNAGVALNSSLNPKEVIEVLYKEAGRLVDTSNFALAIYDQPKNLLSFVSVLEQGKRISPFSVRLTESPDLTGYVLATQSPLLIHDLATDGKKFELTRLYPAKQPRSWLGVPIINPALTDEIAQGVIVIWANEPNVFSDHDLWLLSAMGTQASIALRNARLFDNSQRRAAEMAHLKDMAQRRVEEMAFLNDVARSLSSTLHLDKVLTKIMEQVEDMLEVEAGSLLLTDAATGDLVFQIALGEKAKEVKPFRVPKGQGIAGQVAQTGQPLIIADVGHDERHFKAVDEKTQFNTRNILCVPLILHDQSIGVLQVLNKKVGDFTQNDADLLTAIASYAAIAIENARLYESLEAEHNRTIQAEQAARKKLATDLHDGPTQLIAAVMMNLDFATKALQKDPSLLPNAMNEMKDLASRASHQMRTLLFELRPLVLETQGLGAALQIFLERRQKDIAESQKTGLSLKIETDQPGGDISRQDGKVEATIFAIVQETVNNAIKHAKADNIAVTLKETADGVYTQIDDDGVGFDLEGVMRNYEARGSLGMINLRERAESIGGEFIMESSPGQGTHISIYVPKEQNEKEKRMKQRTVTGILKFPGEDTFESPTTEPETQP
jgi:signal transduction histidine kinase